MVRLLSRKLDLSFAWPSHWISSLVARVGRWPREGRLARARSRRNPAGSRHSAGSPEEGSLRRELAVFQPDPIDEGRDHDDDPEHGEDVRAGPVLGPEGPERADLLAPFFV